MEEHIFLIRQSDYSDRTLKKEFGKVILRTREWWRRVIEPLFLLAFWYFDFSLLSVNLAPKDDYFLAHAMMKIGLVLTAVYTAVGIAITVYFFCFRTAVIGRKRLNRLDGQWAEYDFMADKLTVRSEQGPTDVPYEAKIFEMCWQGRAAFYFKIVGLSTYVIVQRNSFVTGDIERFPDFIREKMNIPLKKVR